MAQRSKHYDWFQGQNNYNDPKENFKVKAKTTWKFMKIFLYFLLFFFSMWGCVQVFTHKIDTKPAAGVTFSNGDGNLSPQVRNFKVIDKNAQEIYFEGPKIDYMATTSDSSADKRVIANVNQQLQDDLGVSSPTKARKGGNYVITLQDANNNYIGQNKDGVFAFERKTLKSSAETKLKTALYTTADIDSTKYKYYDFEASIKILKNLAPMGITRYIVDNKGKQATIKDVYKIDFNSLKNNLSHNDELAFYFNVKVFEAIYNDVIKKSQPRLFNPLGYKKGQSIDATVQQEILNRQIRINFLLSIIQANSGYKTASEMELSHNPIGFSRNTNWVPITNWEKAWSKDGGTGPFYGVFVYPIAFITNKIINSMPFMDGWESLITIVTVVVTLSILMFALNFKNTLQQTKMQELGAKKAVIDAKYVPYKGNKQMENRQKQEVANLYKKEGISPVSQIGSLFLRMPFFLAMWRVIGAIDHIKSTEWLGINFATTSWRALLGNLSQWNNGWAYFPLISLAVILQLLSSMLPKILTKRRNKNRMNVQQKEAMKKSDRTQKIMMIVTLFFPLITSAGVQMYFIIRSLWTIFEQVITHHILIKKKKRDVARGIK